MTILTRGHPNKWTQLSDTPTHSGWVAKTAPSFTTCTCVIVEGRLNSSEVYIHNMFSLFQMTTTSGGQASSPFSSWKAPPLVTSQPDFITSHHVLVNEADSFQAAPFPERAVKGGPGLRVGAQSRGEVGISAAQGEEAVPSRGPPGLRVLWLWRPPHAVPERPRAGVPGGLVWPRRRVAPRAGRRASPRGSCNARRAAVPAPRIPAPLTPAPAQNGPSSPGLAPGPPLSAASPWAPARAPGAAPLRRLSAGAEDVSLAFFQTPTKFRSFGDSLSLPRLWEEVASAPLPSQGPLATGRRTGTRSGCAPRTDPGPCASSPPWGQLDSSLLPNSVPIITPVHQHHQVNSEKSKRSQETPPRQPHASVCAHERRLAGAVLTFPIYFCFVSSNVSCTKQALSKILICFLSTWPSSGSVL